MLLIGVIQVQALNIQLGIGKQALQLECRSLDVSIMAVLVFSGELHYRLFQLLSHGLGSFVLLIVNSSFVMEKAIA